MNFREEFGASVQDILVINEILEVEPSKLLKPIGNPKGEFSTKRTIGYYQLYLKYDVLGYRFYFSFIHKVIWPETEWLTQ